MSKNLEYSENDGIITCKLIDGNWTTYGRGKTKEEAKEDLLRVINDLDKMDW